MGAAAEWRLGDSSEMMAEEAGQGENLTPAGGVAAGWEEMEIREEIRFRVNIRRGLYIGWVIGFNGYWVWVLD